MNSMDRELYRSLISQNDIDSREMQTFSWTSNILRNIVIENKRKRKRFCNILLICNN